MFEPTWFHHSWCPESFASPISGLTQGQNCQVAEKCIDTTFTIMFCILKDLPQMHVLIQLRNSIWFTKKNK